MNRSVLIGVIVAVVVIVGGGGAYLLLHSSSQTNSTSTTMPMNMSNSSGANAPQATNSVTIENFAFSPASITVKKGTTVTWTNKDSTGHTVAQDTGSTTSGPGLDSKVLATGETYKATFNTVGTFGYHCSIHPTMTGKVTVTE